MHKGLAYAAATAVLVGAASVLSSASTPAAGYPAAASKRAYLMASAAETGATYAVNNASGQTVASGSVGASLGS